MWLLVLQRMDGTDGVVPYPVGSALQDAFGFDLALYK